MFSRSPSNLTITSLEIHLPKFEPAIRLLEQHVHLGFCLIELGGGGAKKLHAFLEQLQRRVEAHLLSLESGDDLVQPAEAFLEIHELEGYKVWLRWRLLKISACGTRQRKRDHLITPAPRLTVATGGDHDILPAVCAHIGHRRRFAAGGKRHFPKLATVGEVVRPKVMIDRGADKHQATRSSDWTTQVHSS